MYMLHNDDDGPCVQQYKDFKRVEQLDKRAETHGSKPSITLTEVVDPDVENNIVSCFPEFNITFTHSTHNAHAYFSMLRRCEVRLLLEKLKCFSHTNKPSNYDYYAIDIGGSWTTYRQRDLPIHCCSPVLSSQDAVRHTTRNAIELADDCNSITLQHKLGDTRELKSSQLNKPVSHCFDKGQDCVLTAPFLMFVHSIYDIKLKDLADIFEKKRSIVGYATVLFDPIILIKDEGEFNGVIFKKDKSKNLIYFNFKNDCSHTYCHKLSTYLAYFMSPIAISTTAKTAVVMELLENRGGVQLIKLTVPNSRLRETKSLEHRIWIPSNYDKYIVRYYDIDERQAAAGRSNCFVAKELIVEKRIWNELLGYALRYSDDNFKLQNLFAQAFSLNRNVYIGGKEIARKLDMDVEELFKLAVVVYLYAYQLKYNNGKMTQQMLRDIEYNRSLARSSLFGKLFKSRPNTVVCPEAFKIHIPPFVNQFSIFSHFHSLLYNKKKLDHALMRSLKENAITYMDFRAEVANFITYTLRHDFGCVEYAYPTFNVKQMNIDDRRIFYNIIEEQLNSNASVEERVKIATALDLKFLPDLTDENKLIIIRPDDELITGVASTQIRHKSQRKKPKFLGLFKTKKCESDNGADKNTNKTIDVDTLVAAEYDVVTAVDTVEHDVETPIVEHVEGDVSSSSFGSDTAEINTDDVNMFACTTTTCDLPDVVQNVESDSVNDVDNQHSTEGIEPMTDKTADFTLSTDESVAVDVNTSSDVVVFEFDASADVKASLDVAVVEVDLDAEAIPFSDVVVEEAIDTNNATEPTIESVVEILPAITDTDEVLEDVIDAQFEAVVDAKPIVTVVEPTIDSVVAVFEDVFDAQTTNNIPSSDVTVEVVVETNHSNVPIVESIGIFDDVVDVRDVCGDAVRLIDDIIKEPEIVDCSTITTVLYSIPEAEDEDVIRSPPAIVDIIANDSDDGSDDGNLLDFTTTLQFNNSKLRVLTLSPAPNNGGESDSVEFIHAKNDIKNFSSLDSVRTALVGKYVHELNTYLSTFDQLLDRIDSVVLTRPPPDIHNISLITDYIPLNLYLTTGCSLGRGLLKPSSIKHLAAEGIVLRPNNHAICVKTISIPILRRYVDADKHVYLVVDDVTTFDLRSYADNLVGVAIDALFIPDVLPTRRGVIRFRRAVTYADNKSAFNSVYELYDQIIKHLLNFHRFDAVSANDNLLARLKENHSNVAGIVDGARSSPSLCQSKSLNDEKQDCTSTDLVVKAEIADKVVTDPNAVVLDGVTYKKRNANGDGNCLFYAVALKPRLSRDELRTMIETVARARRKGFLFDECIILDDLDDEISRKSKWGGTAFAMAYCQVTNKRLTILDNCNNMVVDFNTDAPDRVVLSFTGSHYDYFVNTANEIVGCDSSVSGSDSESSIDVSAARHVNITHVKKLLNIMKLDRDIEAVLEKFLAKASPTYVKQFFDFIGFDDDKFVDYSSGSWKLVAVPKSIDVSTEHVIGFVYEFMYTMPELERLKLIGRYDITHALNETLRAIACHCLPNRAAVKLLEILFHNEKFLRCLRNSKTLLDLGGAPGGFVRIMNELFTNLRIDTVSNDVIEYYDGLDAKIIIKDVNEFVPECKYDALTCDIADSNEWKSNNLVIVVLNRIAEFVKLDGQVLIKLANVGQLPTGEYALKDAVYFKPKYSRAHNSEIYLLATVSDSLAKLPTVPSTLMENYALNVTSLLNYFIDGNLSNVGDHENIIADLHKMLKSVSTTNDTPTLTKLYDLFKGIVSTVTGGNNSALILSTTNEILPHIKQLVTISDGITYNKDVLYDLRQVGDDKIRESLKEMAYVACGHKIFLLMNVNSKRRIPIVYLLANITDCKLHNVPAHVASGDIIIEGELTLKQTAYSIEPCFTQVSEHRQKCTKCRSGEYSGSTSIDVDATNIYHYCGSDDDVIVTEKISTIADAKKCDLVFKFQRTSCTDRDGAVTFADNTYTVYCLLSKTNSDNISGKVKETIDELVKLKKTTDKNFRSISAIMQFNSKPIIRYLTGKAKKFCYLPGNPLDRLTQGNLPEIKLSHQVYKPTFKFNDMKADWNYNCCKEYLERQRVATDIITDNLHQLYYKHIHLLDVVGYLPVEPTLGIYDVNRKSWIKRPPPSDKEHQCAYDGKRLIDFSAYGYDDIYDVADNVEINGKYLFVDRSTILMNDKRLHDACTSINLDGLNGLGVTLVQGVPGCAKTTQIIDSYKHGDLILAATREGAVDIRERLEKKLDDEPPTKCVLTVDSFLINTSPRDYDRVFVDEGFMLHAGQLLFAAVKAGAKQLIVFGDSNQIPFINRLGNITPKYHDINDVDHSTVIRAHSFRIPCDVAAVLNSMKIYPHKITSSNKAYRTIQIKTYSLRHIPRDKQILTYTQAEKATLRSEGFQLVNTAGEYQGKQTDDIIVVRINPKPLTIYSDKNQAVVLLSRHRKSMIYYTVTPNDFLSGLIRHSVPLQSIKNCYSPPVKIPALRGGYTSDLQVPENYVEYKPAKIFDVQHQRKTFKTFTYLNGFNNKIASDFRGVALSDDFVVPERVPQFHGCADISVLQNYYDLLQPGGSLGDYDNLYADVERSDYNICIDGFRVNTSIHSPLNRNINMLPNLRTAILPPVTDSWQQVVKAFTDRNGNPPTLDSPVNVEICTTSIVDRFIATFISEDKIHLLHSFRTDQVELSVHDLEKWASKQPKAIIDALEIDSAWNRNDLTFYELLLKRNPKPNLDKDYAEKISSPQVIAACAKELNALFSPIISVLKRRLLAILKKNFVLNTDISNEEFSKLLSHRFPTSLLAKLNNFIEVDFSKYDKSQGYLVAELEEKLMVLLGFPASLISMWRYCHYYTTLMHRKTMFKSSVYYQRKSGDAMTYFGNTLVLMAAMCTVYDLTNTISLFSGDDSLVFHDGSIESGAETDAFANIFNFEAKLLDYPVPYFCSKFLLHVDNYWYFVPDPLKILLKLGRRDLVDAVHVEEYRRSLLDLCDVYNDGNINIALSHAMSTRYTTYADYSLLINTMMAFITDHRLFASLYTEPDSSEFRALKHVKTRLRPNLEI